MRRLTCEMCGGTDLVKQDGFFVCQGCGCKYSVEEAKKMMQGDASVGTSGASGANGESVPVRNTAAEELAGLYELARRAKNDNNAENAAKYYDMILLKDPTSWEASFYLVYFQAWQCKIAQIQSAAISVSNCLGSVFALIRDHVPKNEQAKAVEEVISQCEHMGRMLAVAATTHFSNTDASIMHSHTQEFMDRILASVNIVYTCGDEIQRVFKDQGAMVEYAAVAWKRGIAFQKETYFASKEKLRLMALDYAKKIGAYDHAYYEDYVRTMQYENRKGILEYDIGNLKAHRSCEQTKRSSMMVRVVTLWVIAALFLVCGLVFLGLEIAISVILALIGVILRVSTVRKADKEIARTTAQIQAKEKELRELKK